MACKTKGSGKKKKGCETKRRLANTINLFEIKIQRNDYLEFAECCSVNTYDTKGSIYFQARNFWVLSVKWVKKQASKWICIIHELYTVWQLTRWEFIPGGSSKIDNEAPGGHKKGLEVSNQMQKRKRKLGSHSFAGLLALEFKFWNTFFLHLRNHSVWKLIEKVSFHVTT